jgi:CopG-like RHH_1 or ribbon-helix-helix domain, RHH_5
MSKREQVSVPLPAELREFVERAAVREDRTLAGQIRHLIAEAARNSEPRSEAA